MARRPFLEQLRRPGPVFWDVALALVLAGLFLATVETGEQSPAGQRDVGVSFAPPPRGLEAGDPWNVELRVEGPTRPLTPGEPRLTIQNVRTGETTTFDSRPTSRPGVYRLRVAFPARGVYSYWVTGVGFESTVAIGMPTAAPSHRSTSGGTDDGSSSARLLVLGLAATLPVALRRRYPIVVLAVTLAAALVLDVTHQNFYFPGALVALYTVAVQVGRPASVWVGAATALALAATFLDEWSLDEARVGSWEDVAGSAAMYGVFAAAWLLGDNLRTRRAYLRELEQRAARLEREREASAQRAAAEEQARIARELHDIVAHNVSVMTVQAAAAGDAFDAQPERAREALGSIESTGRAALTELRRLLGRVAVGDGVGAFAPQPGLDRLDALVEQVRSAGLAVDLTVEGRARELPPGVDLSAYRIVQEALTNTLKHGGATQARVHLRFGDAVLHMEIVDDGRGATADGADGGRGIIGMKERVSLLGGRLGVGPSPSGGFAVHATIPLEEPAR